MKLLLDGKPRNIYFRKDNTAYYKSNGNENNITHYFKKTGGLKKIYSNLLVENNKTITVQPLKNRKIILGGTGPIFKEININIPNKDSLPIDKVIFIKGLLQFCMLCKFESDNNNGIIAFLTENEQQINKERFILLLQMNHLLFNISEDFSINVDNYKENIKNFLNSITYNNLGEQLSRAEDLIIKEGVLDVAKKASFDITSLEVNLDNIIKLIEKLDLDGDDTFFI